ncbi:hypothetical protein GA0074695_4011 [Micromonospora viridifaciens]|uniref:DUF4878 domain-containing protein n=2 Tax=Micromonospora viridifaciens TaxID=1881 RepID=A0A1C4YA83_MICVI|nr:hypothetical protein GA0074695_4011 [Micromonospora viridifaciens]
MPPLPPHSGGTGGWSTGAKVGIVAAIFGALAICALPVVNFFFMGPDIGDAKAVAEQYFDRIEAGDDARAYQLLCAKAQKATTQDAFVAKLKDSSRPVDHTVLDGGLLHASGYEAWIDVRLVEGTGATREVRLSLEGNGRDPWRVCGDTFI